MRATILYCICFFQFFQGSAQYELNRITDFSWLIEKDGIPQPLANTGGLNNPQVSMADLTGDGHEELYVFDRRGDVHLAFHRDASNPAGWKYDPTLTDDWPAAEAFGLLRDFNSDGVPDLFSHGISEGVQGIKVFEGFRQNNGRVSFSEVVFSNVNQNVLHFGDRGSLEVLYCVISDVPAIVDLDGDGDLDILSFDDAGGYIDHYLNIGTRTGAAQTFLQFEKASSCFGGVYETNLDGLVNLASAPGSCADPAPFTGSDAAGRTGFHPGSTLTTYDVDQDGDLDLLMGDVNTGFITHLTNTPVGGSTYFTSVDYEWPASTVPVDVDNFPTVFVVNSSPSGGEELLVSPSNPGGGEDLEVLWRYGFDDETPGLLTLLQKDFLAAHAFDHGTGAKVAFADLTGDGLEDMLIGKDSKYASGNQLSAELSFYAATASGYVEENPQWLQQLNAIVKPSLLGLQPVFYDMNSDGKLDLLLGNDQGLVSYAENTSPTVGQTQFAQLIPAWMDIDVGTSSSPAVADLTGDGLPDLLIGERRGKLAFFPNQGSATSPQFSAVATEDLYGAIDVRVPGFAQTNPRPGFIEINGEQCLYVGTQQGQMHAYNNLPTQAGGTANSVGTFDLAVGEGLAISFGHDPSSSPLVAVGTSRGGVTFWALDGLINTSAPSPQANLDWSIFPNPSGQASQTTGLPPSTRLRISDPSGKIIVQQSADDPIHLSSPGVYLITPFDNLGGKQIAQGKRLVILPN